MDWSQTGFSGKTLTLLSCQGNMPLESDGVTPEERFPRCIVVGFGNNGWMLNAVGLSNFGAEFYLKSGEYHKIQKPFFFRSSVWRKIGAVVKRRCWIFAK